MATPLKSSVKTPRKASSKATAKPSQGAKKPAVKPAVKSTVKRTSTAKLKVVAKKPVLKKPVIKKPVAKKTAPKKPVAKTAPAKRPSRNTLISLRSHVDDIEKRLKRANSLTRTSVRALKTSYEALEGDTRTKELTGHIESLSDRLTGMIEQTRQDVGHDLRIVLNDPRLETLSSALTKANRRLTAAEHQQAEAINGINAHIAKLATVVDARMQREERQRQKGEALLTSRMDEIEQDSANAIKSIGENIVRVSEDVTEKTKILKGELAEQALSQRQDYEEHKCEIAQRIEALEDEQRNQLPAYERNIKTLSTRLEALENNTSVNAMPSVPIMTASTFEAAPQMPVAEPAAHINPPQADDAFSALELLNKPEVAQPLQEAQIIEPEVAPELVSEVAQSDQPFAPVEYVADAVDGQSDEVFSPRAFVPSVPSVKDEPELAPQILDLQPEVPLAPMVLSNEPQIYTAPGSENSVDNKAQAPQVYAVQSAYEQAPPPMLAVEPYVGLPPMPATAAAPEMQMPEMQMPEVQMMDPSMGTTRPGTEPIVKSSADEKRKNKKRKGGGNNGGGHGLIRKIALFSGVAVVALFAYKTFAPKIFGADDNIAQTTQAEKVAQKQQPSQKVNGRIDGVVTTDRLTFETTEPVGDYLDAMAAPDLGQEGTQARTDKKQTLEAAAADGNAVAQFQLGLSHLEAGRNADAVRLIRLSANQGQPAAQYRLAKLYEAGIGVKVNGKTAKDLLSRAADAGNRIAMHDLGHYYATGADGASPDLQQAVKWFSMAAERGVLDSQFNLAVLYQGGSGVTLSLEEAYVWYAIAGAQGDKMATQRSQAVALELSEDGLAKAKSRVKAFAPKPVNNAANGIFKNLPWASQKQRASQKEVVARTSGSTGVKGAQQMLASLGYPVGTPDGSLGPNTRNAIISFERANGLPETGRVNAVLIERLQIAVGV